MDGKNGLWKKFTKKEDEEPGWDDGREEHEPDKDSAAVTFANKAMGLYGGVCGTVGAQFAKYLHQVFACNAYGIELTSRKVPWYSTPQIAADLIIFFFLYGAIVAMGALIGVGLREMFLKDLEDVKDKFGQMLAKGFFWLVATSALFFFLPVNVFLIGVP